VQLPQQMSHSSNQVSASQLNNCTSCHTVGKVATSGTRLHPNLSPAPTACASCHMPGGVPTGLVGPVTGSTDPSDMNHAALYSSGTAVVSAQDCAVCHTSGVGTSWGSASFHKNTGSNSMNACVSCHILSLPKTVYATSTTYTPAGGSAIPMHFSHQDSSVTADCVSCHTQQGPPNTWVTSVKIHSILPTTSFTTCAGCHTSDAPASTVAVPYGATKDIYMHSTTYSNYDCASCHGGADTTKQWVMNSSATLATAPTAANVTGVTWAGGLYNHIAPNGGSISQSTCGSCHGGSGFYNHGNLPSNYKTTMQPCKACH